MLHVYPTGVSDPWRMDRPLLVGSLEAHGQPLYVYKIGPGGSWPSGGAMRRAGVALERRQRHELMATAPGWADRVGLPASVRGAGRRPALRRGAGPRACCGRQCGLGRRSGWLGEVFAADDGKHADAKPCATATASESDTDRAFAPFAHPKKACGQ